MKQPFSFSVLILICLVGFSQTKSYSGKMNNVHFDYPEKWTLDDDPGALVITGDNYSNFVEIHRDTLTMSEADMLVQIQSEGNTFRETVFNGMKAYEFRQDGYFIFKNNVMYYFSAESRGADFREQLAIIIKSFIIKD